MRKKRLFLFNIEGGNYVESLLIAAVTTILGIRFYLDLTGYPKIGGGGLHIAHMLWGGMFMLLAIFLLLLFLNRSLPHFAAIIGGIGFGTFIDELGKFITSDNNYFFEPTFAIIYVIFIVLFLLLRLIEKRHTYSQEEYIENAFELTREALLEGKDSASYEKALAVISHITVSTDVAKYLQSILYAIPTEAVSKQNIFSSIRMRVNILLKDVLRNSWFLRSVTIFFIGYSLYNLWAAYDVVSLFFRLNEFNLSFVEWGKFLSSIASSLIVVVGIIWFTFSHVGGYKIFKLGVLFSLFVTQLFDFYNNQLAAAGGFLLNIFILLALNTIIQKHHHTSTL